jgi:hypothetical protein
MIQTVFTTTETIVTAAMKMVSIAPDHGLICQSNFCHRAFDAKKSFAKPTELRNR